MPPVPYVDPLVLEREVKTTPSWIGSLGTLRGPLILLEEGPLDGPERGFGAMAKVPAAGQYTVTSACVGASGATVSAGHEHPGAPFQPMDLALECSEVTSRMIALEQGFVFAHLVLRRASRPQSRTPARE